MPRPLILARGNPPSMAPGTPASADGTALRLVPNSAVAPGLIGDAAAAQLCGADNAPTKLARPIPAVAAALVPRPGKPADASTFVPDPSPPSAGASVVAAVLARLAFGIRLCSWFALDRPALAIHPVELVIDSTVLIELIDDDNDDNDDVDEDDVDDAGAASPCSVCGMANIACDSVAWVFEVADVAVAWATAAPWVASAVGLVVCCGGVNGVNVDAAAEEAAYPYMAAASWAHISPYCASVAAIAGVFCPRILVAISAIN